MLADQGITCSMSRRGDCWDNAAMESFFSTLELERTNRKRYAPRDQARADVFDTSSVEVLVSPRKKGPSDAGPCFAHDRRTQSGDLESYLSATVPCSYTDGSEHRAQQP